MGGESGERLLREVRSELGLGQVLLRGKVQGEELRDRERPQLGAWKLQPHGAEGVRPSQNREILLVLSRVVPGPPL